VSMYNNAFLEFVLLVMEVYGGFDKGGTELGNIGGNRIHV